MTSSIGNSFLPSPAQNQALNRFKKIEPISRGFAAASAAFFVATIVLVILAQYEYFNAIVPLYGLAGCIACLCMSAIITMYQRSIITAVGINPATVPEWKLYPPKKKSKDD